VPNGRFFRSLAFFVVVVVCLFVCLFLSLRLLSLSRKKLLPRLHFEIRPEVLIYTTGSPTVLEKTGIR